MKNPRLVVSIDMDRVKKNMRLVAWFHGLSFIEFHTSGCGLPQGVCFPHRECRGSNIESAVVTSQLSFPEGIGHCLSPGSPIDTAFGRGQPPFSAVWKFLAAPDVVGNPR